MIKQLNISVTKQNGIALVLVLWMLSLLIILATGYSRMMRTETLLTANLVNNAKARSLAETGISMAISELLIVSKEDDEHIKTDGSKYLRNFNQQNLEFGIQAESGKIDLNHASSELLYGLLSSSGVSQEQLLPLVHAILDWRDKDNLVRTHGAEDPDYINNGLEYGAKDGLFNSIDELMLVRGMTPDLFNIIKPSVTIYSHQAGIYPHAASRKVLSAIPNLTEDDINIYIEERESALNENEVTPPGGINPKFLARTKGEIYTILSKAVINNTSATIEAVVLLQKNDNVPYSVLSWSELPMHEANNKENSIEAS